MPASAREKTDVVILDNGDHITGEIMGMSRGKLDLKTDDVGHLSIEWLKVAEITSDHVFEVELSSGETHVGPLIAPAALKDIGVGPDAFPIAEVVAINALDEAFWERVRAYLDLGFTVAKSNRARTLFSDGEFAYRGKVLGLSLYFDSYFQDDANSSTVSRNSVLLTGTYFFTPWKANLSVGADQNQELDLDLRISLGAGVAYAPLRNDFTELWIEAGLLGAQEQYANGSPTTSLSGYLDAKWEVFRYDTPKLDATVEQSLIPVLTDLGRLRGTTTVKVKYEVFKDFNAGFNFSYTFDTRPPDASAATTDYITSLTIGWSYRR